MQFHLISLFDPTATEIYTAIVVQGIDPGPHTC
jgi:hypothetical protein